MPIEERLKKNKKLLAFFYLVCFTESVRADAVKALARNKNLNSA